MRKSKDIKRKRRQAGMEYRKGNRKEAYGLWTGAKKELEELRQQKKAKGEKPAETPAPPAAT